MNPTTDTCGGTHQVVTDPGYGKLKGQTFRLSNMGDETEETVSVLLACLDDSLG
jgi:aspartate aminotransferase-like enzyme